MELLLQLHLVQLVIIKASPRTDFSTEQLEILRKESNALAERYKKQEKTDIDAIRNQAKEKIKKEIKKLKTHASEKDKEITFINTKLRKSIRGLETIRFNPFPDQGSNQSFAIGALNEDGDGVVISSLYSRERMSVFAKPIKNNKSEYELTDEEREVLEKAKI
jgi:hypothetical protein